LAATDFAATSSVGVMPMPPMGARSLIGSNASLLKLDGNVAITAALTSSVQPSALALTTAAVPILPVAPGRFSMTKLLFRSVSKRSASRRAATSAAPPAG
jgi:hypothetical protein